MHHMIVDRLKAAIQTNDGLGASADYAALQALLADPKNHPYLFMGCHGPDPFFFNTKDMPGPINEIVSTYIDLADFLADFEKALLDVVPEPVLDALEAFDEAANEVIQDSALLSEIQQTFNQLNQVLAALADTLTEGLKRFVTEFNLYDVLSHPYRDGANEGEWWWFDAMHYRKTGKFTEAMLDASQDLSSPTHLYALGYLTHVAADTVGHAYVNLNAGGPYRSQSQRHKTLENFQDVFNKLGVTGTDYNHCKDHALYNFNYTGTVSDTEPADHPRLPDDLANFLADTMNRMYQEDADSDPDYAKRITAEDVDDTYRVWYHFMRSFTDTGTLPPPVAYSLTAELREVWEKTKDNLGAAGDFLSDAVDEAGDWGILAIFVILAALAIAAVMAAAAIADAIAGAVATLGTATIRYAACLIYEQVYNAFQNFRLAIALNGLGFPMLEHLDDPHFQQFITPSQPDSTGTTAADVDQKEPLLRFTTSFLSDPLATIFSQERHLIYPITGSENVTTTPAPASYLAALPTHYAWGRIPLDRELVEELKGLESGGDLSEQALMSLLGGGKRTLGNSLKLSGELYDRWRTGSGMPDFNLDSDRGYGYLCWTQRGDPPHEPSELVTNATDPGKQVDLEILP